MPLSQNSFNDQMIKQPYLCIFHTPNKSANQNDITAVVINPSSLTTVAMHLLLFQSDGVIFAIAYTAGIRKYDASKS